MDESNRSIRQIMRLREVNCRNCYKCVRACPVKAIAVENDQAVIKEDRCIYCGKCYMVCPQDARDMLEDLGMVKAMIAAGEKVYVSLSSAFSTYFDTESFPAMGAALKKLGVTRVEETAVGGNRVIEEYTEIINSGENENLISSLCPSTNFMIQKYCPDLIKWLMPVDTPLEAHARMMRAAYGDDIKVVGIGPCIAHHRLIDYNNDAALIDAYITYEELENWLKTAGVEITEEEDPDTIPASDYHGRYLDEAGGLFRALPNDIKYKYKTGDTHGSGHCRAMLAGIEPSRMHGYCLNISACANVCLGGPVVRLAGKDTFESQDRWMNSLKINGVAAAAGGRVNPSEKVSVDVRKTFEPHPIKETTPTEENIEDLLELMGRRDRKDQLDCGGCGYPTCRAKAVAVFHGMADPYMCIPLSLDKAEAKTNLLFDCSPNGVVVMDRKLNILEMNRSAEDIMGFGLGDASGDINMKDYLDAEFLEKAMIMEKRVSRKNIYSEKLQKQVFVSFFKVPGHDFVMMIMMDMTKILERRGHALKMRADTFDITQTVIEKQMRIAQEIASLLGETTAETKLAFNQLRDSLKMDDEGWL